MRRSCRIAAAATTALTLWLGGQGALAQKSGGILKMPDFASPASMSIHEEVTRAAITVLMPVFNNLVLFDQHKERNTIDTIVPDLAESWAWSEDGKELTFKLHTASNGMTASRSPPPMSSAPGISCRGRHRRNCALIRAKRGIGTSMRSRPKATTKSVLT